MSVKPSEKERTPQGHHHEDGEMSLLHSLLEINLILYTNRSELKTRSSATCSLLSNYPTIPTDQMNTCRARGQSTRCPHHWALMQNPVAWTILFAEWMKCHWSKFSPNNVYFSSESSAIHLRKKSEQPPLALRSCVKALTLLRNIPEPHCTRRLIIYCLVPNQMGICQDFRKNTSTSMTSKWKKIKEKMSHM